MIVGVGSDLTDIRRIQASLDRFGDRFTARIYTELERSRSERKGDRAASYAKRFAAKEVARIHLSMTDETPYAQAFVVIEAVDGAI